MELELFFYSTTDADELLNLKLNFFNAIKAVKV